MKKVAILSLLIGALLLICYLSVLCYQGYINPRTSFSIERAKDISPFVGSFIAVFFSLAGTLLVLENLKFQNKVNASNLILTQKNQFESIFFNLLSLHNKIVNEINCEFDCSYNKKTIDAKGREFFEALAPSIAFDFNKSKEKTKAHLEKIYRNYFAIHTSELSHYFRNLYHIVNFVDKNPYFSIIKNNSSFLQQNDYIKILRAQLTNTEIACLAVNGLSLKGSDFKPLIEKYSLLKNMHFDFDLTDSYWPVIPAPEILANEYPHLKIVYDLQKNDD